MTLENKLNITDSTELARMEEKISKKKAVELFENGYLESLEAGTYESLAMIHKYLFDEIYDFAGEYVRQYSTDNDSDVFTDCEETYYYNGPYNYYVKTEEGFYNLWTGQIES